MEVKIDLKLFQFGKIQTKMAALPEHVQRLLHEAENRPQTGNRAKMEERIKKLQQAYGVARPASSRSRPTTATKVLRPQNGSDKHSSKNVPRISTPVEQQRAETPFAGVNSAENIEVVEALVCASTMRPRDLHTARGTPRDHGQHLAQPLDADESR